MNAIKPNFSPDSDRSKAAYLFRLFLNEVLILIGAFQIELPVSFESNI